MIKHNKVKHYLPYIVGALIFVMMALAIQSVFVYHYFNIRFVIIPSIVGLFFGTLLGVVSDLKKQLKYQSDLFSSLVDFSPDLTYIKNLDGTIEYISPSIEEFCGYPPQSFYENPDLINTIVDPRDREIWDLTQKRRKSSAEQILEVRLMHKNGETVWIEHTHDVILDEHERIIGLRSTNHNITRRKEYEEKVQDLANFDTLTLLPNRRSLMNEIEKSLEDAAIYSSEFSIMFVDLDRFKYINDTFGHTFGDSLLQQVSQRLQQASHLKGFVSRFGGDEFVILYRKNSQKELLETYAQTLLQELNRVYVINDVTVYIDATIGISRYPYDGNSAEVLIKNADIAMYKAKNSKHSQFFFFSEEFSKQSSDFFAIEHSLHNALKNEEITLFYQPQFDIRTEEIIGAEALARWIQPDGTIIPPDQFIPVAEESGLILQLGEHVIDVVIQTHTLLNEKKIDLKIAVNVSPFQLQVKEQYEKIIRQFKESSIATTNIELEITETLFFEHSAEQLENLNLFANEGYTLAIDDFGTGFSSLSYLKNMPAHYLKIDKIFVSNMLKSQADRAIVVSIIAMAHNFNMKVIAEGIETIEELDLLKELGCDYGQGYYYAKPMSQEDLFKFIQEKKELLHQSTGNHNFHI